MNTTVLVCFIVIFLGCCNAFGVYGNYNLPEMYEMDDYSECRRENGLYCKFILKAFPESTDNEVWKIIENIKKNPNTFHRDILYRYRCIFKHLQLNNDEISKLVTEQENLKLKNVSLFVQITDMECRKFERTSLTKDDFLFLYILMSYIAFVAFATIIHNRMQYSREKQVLKVSEYILCFSIKRNWEKFLTPTDHPDYLRLKSFQGLKTVCMFGVIVGHTLMSLIPLSTKNPEIYETIYMNPLLKYVIHFGMHIVQIYFLISAWLFINGIYPLIFPGRNVGVGLFLQGVFVRYGRLFGPLALFVFLSKTTLYKFFERGPQAGHIHINYEACNKNGWATLFMVNSHLDSKDQCYFISWYISTDFQLYIGTLALIYLVVKYKLTEKHCLQILSFLMSIGWIYTATVIYFNGFPVSVGTSPEKSKLENSLSSYETYAIYTSLYSNIGGYCVGIIAGVVYNKLKVKSEVKFAKVLMVCGLIAPVMIFLSIFEYSPFVSAVMGASMKPMFNVGVSCFLLGLAFSKDNTAKRIFEWKYLEYFTKLNYSIYLSHYWTTFGQELLFNKIIEMSYLKIFLIYITDTFLGFLIGFIVFIMFESPLRGLMGILQSKSKKKGQKDI